MHSCACRRGSRRLAGGTSRGASLVGDAYARRQVGHRAPALFGLGQEVRPLVHFLAFATPLSSRPSPPPRPTLLTWSRPLPRWLQNRGLGIFISCHRSFATVCLSRYGQQEMTRAGGPVCVLASPFVNMFFACSALPVVQSGPDHRKRKAQRGLASPPKAPPSPPQNHANSPTPTLAKITFTRERAIHKRKKNGTSPDARDSHSTRENREKAPSHVAVTLLPARIAALHALGQRLAEAAFGLLA